jgi:hypothetical protein
VRNEFTRIIFPGAKQVEIIGIEDKRQITALLSCTMSGDLLPPQLLYQGKTQNCHPKVDFPEEWDFSALKFIKLRVGKYNYKCNEESYRNVFKTGFIIIHVYLYNNVVFNPDHYMA